jgi:lysophospholipase L1-like esterase
MLSVLCAQSRGVHGVGQDHGIDHDHVHVLRQKSFETLSIALPRVRRKNNPHLEPTMNSLSSSTRGLYCAAMLTLYAALATPHALADDRGTRWTTTWTASPQPMMTAEAGVDPGAPASLAAQTVRQVVRVSTGGHAVRIVLSNAYAQTPLHIGEAHIARTAQGSAIIAGTDRPLTFGGQTHAVIPAGAPLVSDPVELTVPALSDLTVSIYIPEPTQLAAFHWTGQQTGYLAAGNVTAATELAADSTFTARLFVSAVLSASHGPARTVAAIGDSITDGSSASIDRNQRWPDLLAERLAPYRVGTINAGISGNQLLQSGMGDNVVARFERDVLAQPGVETAIVAIGINDIGAFQTGIVPSAADLIAGFRQLLAQAESRGVHVVAATIGPFEGALEGVFDDYYTPEKDLVRGEVNAWLRSSDELAAVVDFDLALRDPEHPTRLLPAYDSGDHLHPNDAGYRAMAEAVDLRSLLRNH